MNVLFTRDRCGSVPKKPTDHVLSLFSAGQPSVEPTNGTDVNRLSNLLFLFIISSNL